MCQKITKNITGYCLSCFQLASEPSFICLKSVKDYLSELQEYSKKIEKEHRYSPLNKSFLFSILKIKNKIASQDPVACIIEVKSSLTQASFFLTFCE